MIFSLEKFMRFFLLLICTFIASLLYADEFPVLDILKGNVAFWKLIYSEISINEGLLHDREYPLVIYEKLDLRKIGEKDRSIYVDSKRKIIFDILDSIITLPVPQLTQKQKVIRELFEQHASIDAISGAKDRIRFQQGQKERFREGIERSGFYLDTISAILVKMGLPNRLKYLPHVESSFDHEAYSRVGAAGLWQFMRGTGKMYLTVNYDIDERWDPVKSTEAAAKLLKLNNQTLKSWPLAITAYNHGLGGMKKAVEKIGSNDLGVIIQKHESPSFKFASKNFYASFLAASDIADSTEKYFNGVNIHALQELKSFTLTERITPENLCRILGLDLSYFKKINPAIRPVVYAQNKSLPAGYSINIPRELTDTQIAQLVKNKKVVKQQDQTIFSEGYYTVKGGDNLHSISLRFSTSVSQLIALNSITNSNKIHVGQVLRLPVAETPVSIDTLAISEMQQLTIPPFNDSATVSIPAAKIDTSDHQPVRKEKTTYLKERFADSMAIPHAQHPDWQLFNADFYDLGLEILPGASSASIRVNTGESINRYAEWMNVTEKSILRLNELSSSRLRAGKKLLLPVGVRSDVKKFETSRLEFWMAIEEDFFSRYEITGTTLRTLKKGENSWKICSIEQIPTWLLHKCNSEINLASLKPGIKIRIPKIAPKTSHVPPQTIPPWDASPVSCDTTDIELLEEQ